MVNAMENYDWDNYSFSNNITDEEINNAYLDIFNNVYLDLEYMDFVSIGKFDYDYWRRSGFGMFEYTHIFDESHHLYDFEIKFGAPYFCIVQLRYDYDDKYIVPFKMYDLFDPNLNLYWDEYMIEEKFLPYLQIPFAKRSVCVLKAVFEILNNKEIMQMFEKWSVEEI